MRTCPRVLRRENRAAVFIGKNGGFKCADISCPFDNLILIHSDKGTENREILNHGFGTAYRLHCLTCDLAYAFACDKRSAAVFLCDFFTASHHKSSHDDCEKLLGALILDFLLNMCKRNNVKRNFTAVFRNLFKKRADLHFRTL